MGQCHCRDCQRSSGGPFVAVVVVPIEALKLLKGSPRYFDTLSDRGGCIHRGFCPDCGSPVLAKFDLALHLIGIRAGSLDDRFLNPALFLGRGLYPELYPSHKIRECRCQFCRRKVAVTVSIDTALHEQVCMTCCGDRI